MKTICLLLSALIAMLFCLSCSKTTHAPEPVLLSVLLDSGGYPSDQEISFSCNYSDAVICYTANGSEPTLASQHYSQSLTIADVVDEQCNFSSFRVKAFRDGFEPSETIGREYHIISESTVAAPLILPEGGSYEPGTTIALSCSTPDAQIRYTINGADPNPYSSLYLQPVTLTHSGISLVKARAFLQNNNPSSISYASYFQNHPVQEMVFVGGGGFNNGTSDVTVSSFYIDKHEVIQSEYFDVMGSVPEQILPSKDYYPVYYVSWFDAIEYCNKRSLLEYLSPCYSYSNQGVNPANWTAGWNNTDVNHTNITCNWGANGYRLPTEMEWMFAARGGNLSQEYQYSGCDSLYEVGWYAGNSGYSIHQAATKTPNELTIYDMSGNLWEWCWDIFGAYPTGSQTNPHGAAIGSQRVLRGGSWNSNAESCLIAGRNKELPAYNLAASIGFRCVKNTPIRQRQGHAPFRGRGLSGCY